MLTDLDAELFPDDCEVVEIPLHNQRVYLIQKNGSSSLRAEARDRGWHIRKNLDVRSLKNIDVYLRDPVERYASGVNTFVQHLMRDNNSRDPRTCEFFATRYLFLNRHYLPQWHWLANLARFIDDDCLIRLHPLEHLSQITSRRSRAGIQPLLADRIIDLSTSNDKLKLWFLLDRILIGHCGKSLTWKEILQIYQEHPARPLQIVQSRMEAVRNVLC